MEYPEVIIVWTHWIKI